MPVRSFTHSPPTPLPVTAGGTPAGGDGNSPRTISVDRGWRILSIHPEVPAMFGVQDSTAADWVGSLLWEAFPGWAGGAAERKLRAAMQQHAAASFEVHYAACGACFEIRTQPQWPALSIHFRDLTADRQASGKSLDRSRIRFEPPQVLDVGAVPTTNLACAFDRNGRLTHASLALLERWKIRLAEAKGRTLLELNYPTPVAERLQRHIQSVVATGDPVSEAVNVAMGNGHVEAQEHIFSPLIGADGAVHGVAGAIRILGERPPTESKPPVAPVPIPGGDVQRAKVLGELAADVFAAEPGRLPLPALLERIAAAVGADCYLHHQVLETRARLMLQNSSGVPRDQLGRIAELAFGEDLPGTVAQQRRPVALQNLQKIRTPDGAVMRELGLDACAGHPLQTGDRLLGTLVFGTRGQARFGDEEIRFLESAAALISARLSGEAAAVQAETTAEPAVRGEVLKEEFLSAVVQELRAPLESTLLQIRAIATQASVPEEVRFELETIARNLTTESRLVNDLLDLTRIARGEISIERNSVNLHALLRDALASVKHDLANNGTVLAMNLPDIAPRIQGDAVRLQQVFWNLLKRAIRATPRGGVISVRLSLTPTAKAAVAITDSGVSLAPDQADRVFEPWASPPADTSDPAAGGPLGFGMATVRKIVELHDGQIEITHPKSGRGTSFTVELPLAPEPTSAPDEQASNRPAVVRPAPNPAQPLRILLVEDQPATREALLVLLRQWRHEVIVAGSVREARGLAGQHSFDLVICAVSLPDGSGYELMAALRLDHGLSGIALIGNGTEQDAALGRSAGFVARLSKPVSIEALEKALSADFAAN